ncbi:MAG: nucleotidyltransferase family protein [Acidimicrobiales bacterium]
MKDHIRRIGSFDLSPDDSEPLIVDESTIAELVAALEAERLVGVAVRALDEGAVEGSTQIAERLEHAHDDAMARTLRVELAMLEVLDLLDEHSITHRVLKGSALAHVAAIRPADREFRDVDLLIPAAEIDDTVKILQNTGARRLQPRLSADFDRRFGKSVTLDLDGIEIDLHRTIAPGPFGLMLFPGDLFLTPTTITVGDREVVTLDSTDHLLQACYHAALGSAEPTATNLRDIALLARGPWDRTRFERTIERWKGSIVVARAITLVDTHLGVDVELPVGTTRPADHRLLDTYLRPDDRFAGMALATFRALSTADRIAYARAVGLPEGTSLRDRVGEFGSRIRAGAPRAGRTNRRPDER